MRKLFSVLCVILYMGGGLSAQDMDKVYLKGAKEPLEVDIEEDTYSHIGYSLGRSGDGTVRTKWDRIERVVYAEMEQPPYSLAERFFERGEYENAGKAYGNTIRTRKESWVKVYAGYKGGLCYFRLGKYDIARKFFQISIRTPKSHFEPDCYIMLGRCYLKLGKLKESEKYLNMVTVSKYGPGKKAEAKAVELDIMFDKGEYKRVLPRYISVRDTLADRIDPTRLSISVKIGLCYIYTGSYRKGMKEISDVITLTVKAKNQRKLPPNTANSILVSAYTAKGNGYFKKQKDAKKGLRAYLHAAVTYGDIGGKEVAEASFNAAKCIAELLPSNQSASEKRQMKARALELCSRAKSLYGNAAVLRKINALIEKIQNM